MASQGSAVVDTIEDYSKMKVVELKKLLKDRGLPVTGTKDELIERLKQANEAAEKKLLEETAGDGADATAASIDEELENEIMNDENKVTSTSVVKPGDKRKQPVQNGKPADPAQPAAKKVQVEENKENSGGADAVANDKGKGDAAAEDKKIIILSAVTPEEKKALRAKKFGMTDEEKKEARAKRFGITAAEIKSNNTPVKAPGSATDVKLNKSSELMKKRAERFGLMGAKTKLTPEEEEKRKKRAERFGTAPATPEKPLITVKK